MQAEAEAGREVAECVMVKPERVIADPDLAIISKENLEFSDTILGNLTSLAVKVAGYRAAVGKYVRTLTTETKGLSPFNLNSSDLFPLAVPVS